MSGHPPRTMPRPRDVSRWGMRLAAGYLLFVCALGGYVTYRVLFAPLRSPFVGILMIIAGMPWSTVLGRLFGAHGTVPATLVIATSIGINAALLYGIGRGVDQPALARKEPGV